MGKKVKKENDTPCKEMCEPLHIEGKTVGTTVLLLSSTEEEVLVKACEATHLFAEKGDDNKIHLLELGALEPLCKLIAHNNKLVRRNAFMALGIMASNGDVKNALKKIDIIPSIINKLSPEDDVVVLEFATLCLASLSVDSVCKVQIFNNNGLLPLIQLLSRPDPDVKKNSLDIILNLVQDYQYRQAVHESGGIPPLLELLKSDFPVLQHLALKTLQNITTDKDTRDTFREKQGFEQLMDILSSAKFSDLHDEALEVVANCLSDSECLRLIHKGGGLTRLTEFVLTTSAPEIQSNAVKCIARAAHSSENCGLLHEQNVEAVLAELLSLEDATIKTAVCRAVSAMSIHLASKDRFRDLGCIPAVVQCLNSESLVLREAAALALLNLTCSNQLNVVAVYEADGHKVLIQQLYGSSYETVANSAATLCNMAGQEAIRHSILSHGAIQALTETLKSSNTQVLVSTTQCLAVLACDTNARAELRSAGGLEPLVNLLRTFNKEVLQNACLALKVCASDEPTTVEMCKFGALEILQEINQSVSRRSSYSKLAMICLVNSSASVKYSLTGHLASTDVVKDGFYDAGKACVGQRFLTLEELSMQPVNQQQPIIAINTTAEETVDVSEKRQSNPPARDTRNKEDRKTTRKKKKDNKQKDETPPESPTEKPWKMMDDVSLQVLVQDAKESIHSLSDEREQYAALARLVSEAMGGAVEMEKLHEFPWMLHLSNLKFQLQSNVVPIGLIRKGIYCHRALLFKCLVDYTGMSCTLVRGDYNRAWNEVLIFSRIRSSPPCRYIVDLMHQPGNLLRAKSPSAEEYQTI